MSKDHSEAFAFGIIVISIAVAFIFRPAVGLLVFGASIIVTSLIEMCVDWMRRR
jgi:hypothetical protein